MDAQTFDLVAKSLGIMFPWSLYKWRVANFILVENLTSRGNGQINDFGTALWDAPRVQRGRGQRNKRMRNHMSSPRIPLKQDATNFLSARNLAMRSARAYE